LQAAVEWDPAIMPSQQAGILFQQGVLVDSLTVQDNLRLSLEAAGAIADHACDIV
jgi:ABC-type transporter Mla maintaining outer membrane lipid asymmetry ATPase subunit MlaF